MLTLSTRSMVSSWAVMADVFIEVLLQSVRGVPGCEVAQACRAYLARDSTNEETSNERDRGLRVLFHDPVP